MRRYAKAWKGSDGDLTKVRASRRPQAAVAVHPGAVVHQVDSCGGPGGPDTVGRRTGVVTPRSRSATPPIISSSCRGDIGIAPVVAAVKVIADVVAQVAPVVVVVGASAGAAGRASIVVACVLAGPMGLHHTTCRLWKSSMSGRTHH